MDADALTHARRAKRGRDAGVARWRTGLTVVAALTLLPLMTSRAAGVERQDPAGGYHVDESALPFEPLAGTAARQLWGVLGGAGYRMEVPEDWNGELVMWAHGFAGYAPELTVGDPPFRRWLIENGFAWAASSYRANGYVPTLGARDTYDLSRHFAATEGEPSRVYATGASMGGHITALSIEKYPGYYAGALPTCGVLGDGDEFDFITDVNLAAEAITGVDAGYPLPDDWATSFVPAIIGVLDHDPDRQADLAALTEQRSGGTRPFFDVAFAAWREFLLGLGQTVPGTAAYPATNVATVYQLDDDPALSPDEEVLNGIIARVDRLDHPTPNGLVDIGPIQGNPGIPVLTMHTIGDLFVPFSMEQIYAREVAAHDQSGLLVQRAIRDVGHCEFSPGEWDQGIADLTHWVRNGVTPAGDDILTPSVVAAADFGCRFTIGQRPVLPPCPAA